MVAPVALLFLFAILVASRPNESAVSDPPSDVSDPPPDEAAIWNELSKLNSSPPLTFDEYDYFKGLTDPLEAADLELGLDINNQTEYLNYGFDPIQLATNLMAFARMNKTKPKEFLIDVKKLIDLEARMREEPKEIVNQEPEVSTTVTPVESTEPDSEENNYEYDQYGERVRKRTKKRRFSTMRPAMTTGATTITQETTVAPKIQVDDWKNDLQLLRVKYNISSDCGSQLNCISIGRIQLMFPHFVNFEQRPYAAPRAPYVQSALLCNKQNSVVKSVRQYDHHRGVYYYDTESSPSYASYPCPVPSILSKPDFGGLIPRTGSLIDEDRKAIIGVHLYATNYALLNEAEPFRSKVVLLKKRMEKSLLSDERKIRFLQNNDVIWLNMTVNGSIREAYDSISADFLSKINWNLLA